MSKRERVSWCVKESAKQRNVSGGDESNSSSFSSSPSKLSLPHLDKRPPRARPFAQDPQNQILHVLQPDGPLAAQLDGGPRALAVDRSRELSGRGRGRCDCRCCCRRSINTSRCRRRRRCHRLGEQFLLLRLLHSPLPGPSESYGRRDAVGSALCVSEREREGENKRKVSAKKSIEKKES